MTTYSCEISTFVDLFNFLSTYPKESIIGWLKDENEWKGKEKQESLLRLFAGLGLIEDFNEYDICKGNYNMMEIQKMTSKQDIFYKKGREIYLNDKGDSSDLTGMYKNNDKHLLVTTSKNLKDTSVGKLGISVITYHFTRYQEKGYSMTLCVCIRNKRKLMEKRFDRTSEVLREYLEREDTKLIDWDDLDIAFRKFKGINLDLKEILNTNKSLLILKPHQRLGVVKTLKLKKKREKRTLWGHIQRSGKSYIIGGCIIEDSKNISKCNYLVITTAPNETINQYLKVFDCVQLQEFNVISLNGENMVPKCSNKNIIVCSKQFLSSKVEDNQIKWLKKMNFKMVFLDESHNGGTTKLSQNALRFYGKNAFTVQITATYAKPANDFGIPSKNWILWSLDDINLCKNLNESSISSLVEKHGYEIRDILSQYSPQYIIDEYSKYPELHVLTHEIKPKIVNSIIDETKDNNYGWSLENCFLLQERTKRVIKKFKRENGKRIVTKYEINVIKIPKFQNKSEVLKVWYSIFGKKGFSRDNNSFMYRAREICEKYESRFIGDTKKPMVIMAFLPQNDIEMKSKATKKLLIDEDVIPNYEIVSINSKNTKNPKQAIEDARVRAKNNNKIGVLVLSGRQCSLGVSIYNCDIVILLNNNKSFDMIFQMMFRCMTEGKGKKCGFVIDLSIDRAVNTIVNYATLIKSKLHPRKAIQFVLEERLIALNGDHWMPIFSKNSIFKELVVELSKNLYNIYSSHTEQALRYFLNRLCLKDIKLANEEQKMMNLLKNKTQPARLLKEKTDKKGIKKGVEKTRVNDSDEEEKKINYMDILRHIIPLICLLTINDEETSLQMMYNLIKNENHINSILIEQTKSWWGKNINSEIISEIIVIYIKYMENDEEVKQIIRTIKELFMKNINNRRELSNLIDKYLIPQDLEKKKNAEISTPSKLRQEMLNKIPSKFWEEERKVFEPCSGKGGFLIDIVDRFMTGLKNKYHNEEERYRVIVEKCLYFSDINPTNIFINKLLLDPHKDYNLNFHEGNTLKLDIKEKWGLEGFDAVIGNPPYNSSGNTGTGNTIWQLFTKKSLGEWLARKGYLLFVHPPGWRKPNTKRGKFYGLFELMTKKNQMLYLSIHGIKDGKKTFNCGTRYDWYLVEKRRKYKNTIVNDENRKKIVINMEDFNWLPNYNIKTIQKILAKGKEKKCPIIYDRSNYGSDKKWVSKTKDDKYQYTVVHTIPRTGVRYIYSDTKDKGHFKIPKVIFGDNGLNDVIVDSEGQFAMSENSMAIKIKDVTEGNNIKKALLSENFKNIIKSCIIGNFRIDWRLFTYFKKDFWKEFIDE